MLNMRKKYYPLFPVSFLHKDKFESHKKIKKISIPILILHGKTDKIVPFAMGKKMYELANEPNEIEKVKITTEDNIDLKGWFYNKNLKKLKTILFFHGNAGSLENRTYKLNHFKDLNVNFLIIAWRGFSGNKGKPSEIGLYEDAESAVKWLKSKGLTEEDIILYGESLGTGVAVEIAQNKNYAGIILESPYTSMLNMGKKYYPLFPVSFLLKDKFESHKKIKKISSQEEA